MGYPDEIVNRELEMTLATETHDLTLSKCDIDLVLRALRRERGYLDNIAADYGKLDVLGDRGIIRSLIVAFERGTETIIRDIEPNFDPNTPF